MNHKQILLFTTILSSLFLISSANAYNSNTSVNSGTIVNSCGGSVNDPNCSNTCIESTGLCYATSQGWRVERHTCAENQATYRDGYPVCETSNPERSYASGNTMGYLALNASCSQIQQIKVLNSSGQAVDWIVWKGNCTGQTTYTNYTSSTNYTTYPSYSYQYTNPTYTYQTNTNSSNGKCESWDFNTNRTYCTVGSYVSRSQITITQISKQANCVENSTWGYDNNGQLWVKDGCRLEYYVNGTNQYYPYTYTQTQYPTQTYNYSTNYTGSGYTKTATCESNGGTNYCVVENGQQISPSVINSYSQCNYGYNWGYNGPTQLWVKNGCKLQYTYSSYGNQSCPSGYMIGNDGICRDQV